MSIKGDKCSSVEGVAYTWDLTSPMLKSQQKRDVKSTLAQQLARVEERMEGIWEEEGSDNEVMLSKTLQKRKRILRKNGLNPSYLEEDLGVDYVKVAVLRPFEEVKATVFVTAPPDWK